MRHRRISRATVRWFKARERRGRWLLARAAAGLDVPPEVEALNAQLKAARDDDERLAVLAPQLIEEMGERLVDRLFPVVWAALVLDEAQAKADGSRPALTAKEYDELCRLIFARHLVRKLKRLRGRGQGPGLEGARR